MQWSRERLTKGLNIQRSLQNLTSIIKAITRILNQVLIHVFVLVFFIKTTNTNTHSTSHHNASRLPTLLVTLPEDQTKQFAIPNIIEIPNDTTAINESFAQPPAAPEQT
jgi:hypothetical protein